MHGAGLCECSADPPVRILTFLAVLEVNAQEIGPDDVHDVTVRNHVAQLLERARFADDLYTRFDECVETIGDKVSRITMGE